MLKMIASRYRYYVAIDMARLTSPAASDAALPPISDGAATWSRCSAYRCGVADDAPLL